MEDIDDDYESHLKNKYKKEIKAWREYKNKYESIDNDDIKSKLTIIANMIRSVHKVIDNDKSDKYQEIIPHDIDEVSVGRAYVNIYGKDGKQKWRVNVEGNLSVIGSKTSYHNLIQANPLSLIHHRL